MTGKRSYDDGCAVAHALELIGERWALLIMRELMLGPKRFTDLRAGLPGISPNVLTQRLEELEAASLVIRCRLPPPAAVRVYALTEWGGALEPVIRDIGRWAARSPSLPGGRPMSVSAFILSLRTMFDADRAAGIRGSLELRLGEERFRATLAKGRLDLVQAAEEYSDAVIEGSPNALAALIYGGRSLGEALARGEARVEGDRALVRRFLKLFPLPVPAPAMAGQS